MLSLLAVCVLQLAPAALAQFKADEIAAIVGVSRGMVYQWLHLYRHGGPEAVATEVLAGAVLGVTTLAQVSGLLLSYCHFAGVGHRS